MIRFIPFLIVVFTLFCSILFFLLLPETAFFGWVSVILILIFALGIFDFMQRKSAVLRNYPLIGRLCFLFEEICPHIREYFIEAEDDQVPFSYQQYSIITGRCRAIDVETKAKSSAQFPKITRQAMAKLVGVTELYTSFELTRRHLEHRFSQSQIMLASQICPVAEQGVVFSKSICEDLRIQNYWSRVTDDSSKPQI